MDQKDRIELLAVFAIGAVAGAGAMLLLRPHPHIPERVLRQLQESRKRLGRGARRAAHEAERAGGSLASASRELLDQFRQEAAQVVASAREQLAEDVYAQLRGGSRRRGRRGRR